MPTLEELDGEVWGEPDFPSYVITTCHALRKKDIDQFTVEDLRILIGQTIGMPFLVPRALALLEADAFAAGDFFPGDLLSALVRERNWSALSSVAPRVRAICERAREALAGPGADERFGEELRHILDSEFERYIKNS